MIDNLFKEQYSKHNLMDNNSLVMDSMYISHINGEHSIKIKSETQNYGLIRLSFRNADDNCLIMMNNIQLIKFWGEGEKLIPVKFYSDDILVISGNCDNLGISLLGAKFKNKNQDYYMPKNNLILTNLNNSIYSFGDYRDIISDNLELVEDCENVLSIQSVSVGGEVLIGKIIKNDNVYYCNNMDNYNNKILIAKDVNSIIMVDNLTHNKLFFVKLINNKIVLSSIDNGSFVNHNEYVDDSHKFLLELIQPIVYTVDSKVFGVKVGNNEYQIFAINDNFEISKIYELKANNIRIFEYDNKLTIVTFNGYNATILNFDIRTNVANEMCLICISYKDIENVTDYLILHDKELCKSTGMLWSEFKDNV